MLDLLFRYMKRCFLGIVGLLTAFSIHAKCETGLVSFCLHDTIMSHQDILLKNNNGNIYAKIIKVEKDNYLIEFYQPLVNFVDYEIYCIKLNDTTYLKNGSYTKYFKGDSRKVNIKGNYKNGCRYGKWIHFHENKIISNIIIFDDDEYDGRWIAYYENGNVRSVGSFNNGIENGKWEVFYENGRLKYKGKYDNKLMPNLENNNNDLSCPDKFYPKHGFWVYYYENGKIERIEKYRKGIKNGIWKYFDVNSKLIKKEKF